MTRQRHIHGSLLTCDTVYYNYATTNFAIYSNETSQDKLSKSQNMQSLITTQVHDKLHEDVFISMCSFH